MSRTISMDSGAIRHSVYRGAAAGSSPGDAEVALPLHERVAQAPGLHEPHQGVVDRTVAVRVVLPITSPTTRLHLLKPRSGR